MSLTPPGLLELTMIEVARPGVRARGRRAASWFGSPIGLLTVLTFVVFGTYSVSRYRQYLPAGYDLGIFDQAIRKYSEFKAPIVSLKGPNYNILGDHFHPILAVLAPLYWIWDDPRVLLIAQAVLIAASVPIVYRFTRRRFDQRLSLVISVGYALGWPLQAMADFDFHEIAFGLPLVAWAIDSLDRRSDRGLYWACGLLLLVREDMGIVVLLLGVLRLVRDRRRHTRFTRADVYRGLLLMGVGVAVYLFATQVVLPHFSSTGTFAYWSYDALGPNAGSAIRSILLHPVHAVDLFFTPVTKSRTICYLLAPFAFFSLRSRYFLISLPLFAGRFFSSRPNLWTTEFHYSAIMWTMLALAAIDGAGRLGIPSWRRVNLAWVALPLVLAVWGTATQEGLYPFNRILTGEFIGISQHMRAQQAAVEVIPHDTCVELDDRIAPHLTHSNLVTLPGLLGRTPDFTILDFTQSETGYLAPTPQQALATAKARGDVTIFSRDGMLVLRSASYAGPSARCKA